jgi:Flp pilus assembly protein TadG
MKILRRPDRSRGQGLVEFALVLPVFMVILIGMVDMGRAIWANNSVANAAREAARFASVHGGSCEDLTGSVCSSTNYCPVGPAAAGSAVPSTSTSCPYPSPSKQSIYNTATGFLVGGGSSTTVTACYWVPSTLTNTDGSTRLAATASCSGNTDTASTNLRGAAVTVAVSTQVPMILGSFLGFSTMTVNATSTVLINH